MTAQRVLGLVLLVVGVVVLIFGYNASQSVVDQSMETFTGRFTETTMVYLVAGAASVIAGLGLLAFQRKK